MAPTINRTKKPIVWWAMTDRRGEVIPSTIGQNMTAVWLAGYWEVATDQGEEWAAKYWKKWEPSIRSAKKLGYRFIRVKIVPISNRDV